MTVGAVAARPTAVVTVIWFFVIVPVLSVQITVHDPRVSTEDSRLTRALRAAIRCTPIASASVIVGSRPSGTFASTMPIAKMAPSRRVRPANRYPTTKNPTPITTDSSATRCATRPTSIWSGLGSGRTACVSCAILPNSVRMPVAVTTAVRLPDMIVLPAKTHVVRLDRGPRRLPLGVGDLVHGDRLAGQVGFVAPEVRGGGQARVGRDAVAFLEDEHVAGDELLRQERGVPRPSRMTFAADGQQPLQLRNRPLGPVLLEEPEDRRSGRSPR